MFANLGRLCIVLLVSLTAVASPAVASSELPPVTFGGVMLSVSDGDRDAAFPYMGPLLEEWVPLIRDRLTSSDLPFELHASTANSLSAADDSYPVLSLLISSENTLFDAFEGRTARYSRVVCDLSLTALIFDAASKKVLVSLPITSEVVVKLDRSVRHSEIQAGYERALTQGAGVLVERLKKVSLGQVQANVEPLGEAVRLDEGEKAGALIGSRVTFLGPSGEAVGQGKITAIEPNSSLATLSRGRISPVARFANLKAYAENSFQVVGVDATSKKALATFDPTLFPVVAQWFSDYLSSAGRTVLPPRLGSNWLEQGATQVLRVYPVGSEAISLDLPMARNSIRLDLSGLGGKVISSSETETWRLFKAWTKLSVAETGQVLEVDEGIEKRETNGAQTYSDKEVFLAALQQSLAKLARSL